MAVASDELAAVLGADRFRLPDLGPECRLVLVLDAQLDQLDAERHQPRDPGRTVDDQIERVELHGNTA